MYSRMHLHMIYIYFFYIIALVGLPQIFTTLPNVFTHPLQWTCGRNVLHKASPVCRDNQVG